MVYNQGQIIHLKYVEERGGKMAHKQKYTRGSVGHMLGHYDRSKEVPELKVPANTVLNYNLASNDQPNGQLDFLHQRLSEVRVHNRKDVNVMVDWVITLPQSLNNKGFDNEERFFKEAYKFLNDRYGKENVISAYVHLDETTPHMHYAFVPVVEDKKRGGYKLSAKEAVTREDLRTFHKDMSDHMERVFGWDIGILNETTKEGNKSIEELKRGTAQEELQKATVKTQEMLSNARKLEKAIEVAQKQKKSIEDEIEALQAKHKGTQMKVDEISQISPVYEKGLFGSIKGISGVSVSDIEKLKAMAIEGLHTKDKLERLQGDYDRVRKLVPTMQERMADSKEKAVLREKAQAFDRLPDDIKRQLLSQKNKVQEKGKGREQ